MDRPILFNGDMVRAILSGAKTQTRRPINPLLFVETTNPDRIVEQSSPDFGAAVMQWVPCPFGKPGDRLWVRETWSAPGAFAEHKTGRVFYRADYADGREPHGQRWRPSIHMPRWASRLTLDVVSVRVERLQDISDTDALAEGVERCAHGAYDFDYGGMSSARANFRRLWSSVYGAESWDANPWLWVVEFRKSEVR